MIENTKSNEEKRKFKTYPFSTVAEALCEIHFSEQINHEKMTKLKEILKIDYPDVNERQIQQYRAELGKNGLSVIGENSVCHTFKHNNRNHLLQFFPNMLTINEIGKYPSWEVFIQDVKLSYNALSSIFSTFNINRMGLRYINLVPRENRNETLSFLLNPTKYYPDGILSNKTGFLSRSEFNLGDNLKLNVILSECLDEKNVGALIFDIDALSSLQVSNFDSFFTQLNELHNTVSEVFHSSISHNYESILNGEKK